MREKRRRKSRLVVMPHVLYHHSVRVKRFLFCTSFRTRKRPGKVHGDVSFRGCQHVGRVCHCNEARLSLMMENEKETSPLRLENSQNSTSAFGALAFYFEKHPSGCPITSCTRGVLAVPALVCLERVRIHPHNTHTQSTWPRTKSRRR